LKYPSYTEDALGYLGSTGRQGIASKMARSLEFVFQFPPIYGVFDTGYGVVYIFGELHENDIEDIIAHETLHYVLFRVVGKKASLRLDRIYSQMASD